MRTSSRRIRESYRFSLVGSATVKLVVDPGDGIELLPRDIPGNWPVAAHRLQLLEQIFLACITGTQDWFGTIVGRLDAFLFQES